MIDYKKAILKKFTQNNLKIRIALDCANGSVSQIAPQFFKDIGCDDFFINTHYLHNKIENYINNFKEKK